MCVLSMKVLIRKSVDIYRMHIVALHLAESYIFVFEVIYEALCVDVASDQMKGAPNETQTHFPTPIKMGVPVITLH